MNIDTFQTFLERIDPTLTKEEKKDKMVQIADISLFTQCYSTQLTFMGCIEYDINIMEHNGIKTGILFCDLKKLKRDSFNPWLYTPFSSEFFRSQTNIDDFWFVFVEETINIPFKKFIDFMEDNHLTDYYSKIFLLSYFESNLHQLK